MNRRLVPILFAMLPVRQNTYLKIGKQ